MAALVLTSKCRMVMRSGVPAPSCLEPFRREDGSYSFPVCGDIVRRLMAAFPDLQIDDDLREELRNEAVRQREAQALTESDGEDLPYGDLYPYQRVAVSWLSLVRRGILADEQGLGKTVMAVTAAREASPARALIICSNSKRKDWHDHVVRWIPGASSEILEGTESERSESISRWDGYLVCNYKIASIHKGALEKADLVIVDEAHKMRNKDTDTFKSIRRVCRRASHVFLLTASPTINMAGDIWTLLNLCDPKRFSSYWGFVFRFCQVGHTGFGLKVGGIRDEEWDNLNRIITPYTLKREGMLDLPDPSRRVVLSPMSGEQSRLYDELEELGETEYGGAVVKALTDVSLITRQRQIAQSPELIFPGYDGPSKLDAMEGIIREREGQVVMLSQFAKIAVLAAEKLNAAGISAVYYTGGMTNQGRQDSLDKFRRGEAKVISLTHGVGGEGLDLVEADRAIFLELAWHPAGNKHALRRILRHGQRSDDVEIILIHVPDSIEDHVRDIVREKGRVTIEEIMRRRDGREE